MVQPECKGAPGVSSECDMCSLEEYSAEALFLARLPEALSSLSTFRPPGAQAICALVSNTPSSHEEV